MNPAYYNRLKSAYRDALDTLGTGDRVQVKSSSKAYPVTYTFNAFSGWKWYFGLSVSGLSINPVDIVKVNGVNKVFGDMDATLSCLLFNLANATTTDKIKSIVDYIDNQYRGGEIYIHEQEWPLIEEVARESYGRIKDES